MCLIDETHHNRGDGQTAGMMREDASCVQGTSTVASNVQDYRKTCDVTANITGDGETSNGDG